MKIRHTIFHSLFAASSPLSPLLSLPFLVHLFHSFHFFPSPSFSSPLFLHMLRFPFPSSPPLFYISFMVNLLSSFYLSLFFSPTLFPSSALTLSPAFVIPSFHVFILVHFFHYFTCFYCPSLSLSIINRYVSPSSLCPLFCVYNDPPAFLSPLLLPFPLPSVFCLHILPFLFLFPGLVFSIPCISAPSLPSSFLSSSLMHFQSFIIPSVLSQFSFTLSFPFTFPSPSLSPPLFLPLTQVRGAGNPWRRALGVAGGWGHVWGWEGEGEVGVGTEGAR